MLPGPRQVIHLPEGAEVQGPRTGCRELQWGWLGAGTYRQVGVQPAGVRLCTECVWLAAWWCNASSRVLSPGLLLAVMVITAWARCRWHARLDHHAP